MNYLALMGWSHPEGKDIFTLQEFVEKFSIDRVTLTAPVFDVDKLNWYNGQYIRALSEEDLISRLSPFIPSDCPGDVAKRIIPLIKERLVTLKDFEELTKFFYRDITIDRSILHKKSNDEQVKIQLELSVKTIEQLNEAEFTPVKLEEVFRAVCHDNEWKPSQFFMMLRVAVTGETATPPLFDTMAVIGQEKVASRLRTAAR